MGFNLTTKNGYDLFEMSSMIQKAIRRSDIVHASYAANELGEKYRKYLWKRLLTVSCEDCFGIMTKEIVALKDADEYVNKGAKNGYNDLFIAKAVILLCMARKNRDADYVACNFMWGDRTLTDEEFEEFVDYRQVENLRIEYAEEKDRIPDYVFDCHTRRGKMLGKTKLDMIESEQEALNPKQLSLFDNGSWEGMFNHDVKTNRVSVSEQARMKDFMNDRELDPTHYGENI